MKVAVTAMGGDLDSAIDPRFGRCQYFIIVDTDTLEFKAIPNPNISATGGAGIQSGQLIANEGAEAVITGQVGPNAFQTLSAMGIGIVAGASGTVRSAIEQFKSGALRPTAGPTVPGHYGVGFGPGMGAGRGMGRGRGMGGFGARWQTAPPPPQPGVNPQMSKEQEIEMLKGQADMISQQLSQINERIKKLEEEK
ncbi:MAG: NifB/NifX family molybdenum-iron cluster-binding protein [bacterium]